MTDQLVPGRARCVEPGCRNAPDRPRSFYWCRECNEARMKRISRRLEEITEHMRAREKQENDLD